MSLQIRNTKELLDPSKFRLKMLVYGPSGYGKTEFASGAPNPIIGACETGHGGGVLTVAKKGLSYVIPETYVELERFCSGAVEGQSSYESFILDGFSYLTDTIIKDYVLSTVQRTQGNSGKRSLGVPELDDYGSLAEVERRILAKLLQQDKHIVVTCLQDYYQPFQAAQGNQAARAEKIGGPDLPGMMRLGSAAMFDVVLRLVAEPALKDPRDPKSKYVKRYWQTEGSDRYLAKSRLKDGTKSLFPPEVEFNLDTGVGTFEWFRKEALKSIENLQ